MKKTVLITGASKGIGLALARIFLANDYKVIGTCRSGIISDIQHSDFQSLALDLADPDSIKAFGRDFQRRDNMLDIIINNAGIGPDLNVEYPEENSFQQTFAVNVTGTTFFTEGMSRYVAIGGKIINISSKMGSVSLCELTDSTAYRMSKAALNMYTKILANREAGKRWVAAVHPGWVRTTLSKSNINGRLSPEESANRIFDFVVSEFRTGVFWNVETQSECKW